ncbi:hypothetical protein ACFXBB_21975 [Streptomyces scopuliridis]|uniref:hypothetical protein n=1 Tax=Streptomyces scopuliridis TaxID=452529 RepID=UPI00368F880B
MSQGHEVDDVEIVSRPYEHPHVSSLVERLQAEYVRIYGAPDDSPAEPGQFSPPRGAFAVGYENAVPVAMGGWRFRGDGSLYRACGYTEVPAFGYYADDPLTVHLGRSLPRRTATNS